MQISLRKLFLVFPAFFLAVGVASVFRVGSQHGPVPSLVLEAQIVLMEIYPSVRYGSEKLPTEDEVNKWLGGSLPPNHPARSKLPSTSIRPDRWGRPFRCVINRRWSGQEIEFGVYSTGLDGKSRTSGNDADDINTWNNMCGVFYEEQSNRSNRIKQVLWAIPITPITYVVLLACLWVIGGLRKLDNLPNKIRREMERANDESSDDQFAPG